MTLEILNHASLSCRVFLMYTEYYPTKASKEEVLRRKMRHWGGQVKGPKRTSCSHVWGTKKSMTHRLYWQCSSIAYEFMDALKLPRLFQFLGSMVWEMPYIQRQFCVITSPTSFPLRGYIFFPKRLWFRNVENSSPELLAVT